MAEGSARFETRAADWLSVDEARARILEGARPLPPEQVSLREAEGRVLAELLIAGATLPPWDNSAMDGYAVRADDVAGATETAPVTLDVVGRVLAGHMDAAPTVGPGQATRIMTGAPLPPGTDAVVRVEDTDAESESGKVRVRVPVEAGRYVRPAGQDFHQGDEVLEPGRVVRAGVIGLAAAIGRETLRVHRSPSVALLATGDELRGPSGYEDVIHGRGIPESNRPMLSAMVRDAGASVGRSALATDDEAELATHLEQSGADDVLVTIGGASMGEADLVKRVLDRAGFRLEFWRSRIRPGSPFSFGLLPRGDRLQPVFGLPGNPASAFVTFELFVRPFLRRLAGHTACFRPVASCVAGDDLRGPTDLAAYLRVWLIRTTGAWTARLTGSQGSGLVRGLGYADGLAVLPEGTGEIRRGSRVDVLLLNGDASEDHTQRPHREGAEE
ncbi:MAG: gephyrin-like molybdotransferase Glp [Gemmatimonadota bacterium]